MGGIETFLTGLLEALEGLGCRNTLIATGDSRTAAKLVPVVEENLHARMVAGKSAEYVYYEQHQLRLALERAAEFDLIHSHIGPSGYVLSAMPGLRPPVLHTQHNPVYSDAEWFVRDQPDLWFATVSEFQARAFRRQRATRCCVIHNGIDVAAFEFRPRANNGLLFLGRMEGEKGPDIAIRVARTLAAPLTLAGPIIEPDFFDRAIKQELGGGIQYVGVVDHLQKMELLGRATCVLIPSRVHEGCPLVSMEALACGTPVVSLANGALPEIIEPGVTGYVTSDEAMLPALVTQAVKLDRAKIRERVTARFDIHVVAGRYRELYRRMLAATV